MKKELLFNIGIWLSISAASFFAHEGGSIVTGIAAIMSLISLVLSALAEKEI